MILGGCHDGVADPLQMVLASCGILLFWRYLGRFLVLHRYSAFLDPALVFTTGAAARLKHQDPPSTNATNTGMEDGTASGSAAGGDAAGTAPAAAAGGAMATLKRRGSSESAASSTGSLNSTPKHSAAAGGGPLTQDQQQQLLDKAISDLEEQALQEAGGKLAAAAVGGDEQWQSQGKQQGEQGGGPGVGGTGAADGAEAGVALPQEKWAESADEPVKPGPHGEQAGGSELTSEAAAAAADGGADSRNSRAEVVTAAAAREGEGDGGGEADVDKSVSLPAGQSYESLHESLELLPRVATEGTVVPEATFTPADSYKHETSHKAVLALYELIGGCLSTNTDSLVEEIGVLRGGLGPVEEEGPGSAVWGKLTGRESSSSAGSCGGGGASSGGAGLLGSLLRGKGDARDAKGSSHGGSCGSGSSHRGSREQGKSSLGGKGRSVGGKKSAGGEGYGGRSGAAWFLEDDSGGGGSYNTAVDDDGITDDDDNDYGSSSSSSSQPRNSSSSRPKLSSSTAGVGASGAGRGGRIPSSMWQKSPLSSSSAAPEQGVTSELPTLQQGGSMGSDAELGGEYAALGGGGAEPGRGENGEGEAYETLGASAAVRVRWYDARCRVAVKRVAHWLRVPWPKVRVLGRLPTLLRLQRQRVWRAACGQC